jgi:hypothetical protein
MRSSHPAAGSISDVTNGVAAQLKGLDDLAGIEYRFGRLSRTLEACAERAAAIRMRGGSLAGLDASTRWLEEVIRDHPALQGPEAEGVKGELLRLAHRCRGWA